MATAHDTLSSSLLGHRAPSDPKPSRRSWTVASSILVIASLLLLLVFAVIVTNDVDSPKKWLSEGETEVVESENGVVAADDGRCSAIGAEALRAGGHAVDAAVAVALCVGVVNPMSSGIGGGGFIVVRSAETAVAEAFDARETAPSAASQNMYANNPTAKEVGPLSMGIPGELLGLHLAWSKHGHLPWKSLFQPSIKLARDGFVVAPYLAQAIARSEQAILADPGLRSVFTRDDKILKAGDTCSNPELARSLEAVSEEGPKAFYDGWVGEKLVEDVKAAGGVITKEDLKGYTVEVSKAMEVDVMGFKILGMPLPSSGTLGMSLVLNVLGSYGSPDAVKGSLGVHRLIEALKHMFAVRMNLGDSNFVNATSYERDMLSKSFAEKVQHKIFDNTTFDPGYYLTRWSQLRDHGTSHFCVVDADRNAVSMTTTVNYYFGARMLSPSTGIVLNNEMDDFSTPTERTPDKLPPAPANFIEPNKRPLSSMTPIIVLKNDQLAGVVGGSGGLYIIPAVIQVFLNHFVLEMEPLAAVQQPRVYHKLVPNEALYENWTVIDGERIELSLETRDFLKQRGHSLKSHEGGAICQLIVQNLHKSVDDGVHSGRRLRAASNRVFHGMLTAVSDPRKDGRPAGV
ncbi:Gamma-glutamyltranspeptidase 3 [Acorus gramineus]|uniref:Glutathione hydrolase n=1 Tax=Acorus gramineus TaxID=55184 RepID=A0AAV9B680_ACOGR|nr:Gamma-glutamyltranspeptidase 3 [Acorus gramineus]